MRQLKGLKLSQILLKYVNILPAKFDFVKSEAEQSSRGFRKKKKTKMCQSGHFDQFRYMQLSIDSSVHLIKQDCNI